MDALATAAETSLLGCCADLRAAVDGLDADTLARPPVSEASTLATLVRHSASSTRYLLGAAATGRIDQGRYRAEERPAAFAGKSADATELMALLDELSREIPRLAAQIQTDRLGERVTPDGPFEGEPPTRARMLLQAVEHLREHVGHAQLTRQLLGAAS